MPRHCFVKDTPIGTSNNQCMVGSQNVLGFNRGHKKESQQGHIKNILKFSPECMKSFELLHALSALFFSCVQNLSFIVQVQFHCHIIIVTVYLQLNVENNK